jgi:peptidoglycan/LPS O-acetylase OafA/YrhL
MFVVYAFFTLFLNMGMRMGLVPPLFIAVVLVSVLVGAIVAELYSEPMNRLLRKHSFPSAESTHASNMQVRSATVQSGDAAVSQNAEL